MIRFIIFSLLFILTGTLKANTTFSNALLTNNIQETFSLDEEAPSIKAPVNLDFINNLIGKKIEQIRKSRLVFGWEVASPRDRIPHYCINECACLNRELQPLIKSYYKTYKLMVRPAKGSLDVSIRNGRGELKRYDYHVVTIVKVNDEWFVIDPVVTLLSKAETLSDWLLRLDHPEKLIGKID